MNEVRTREPIVLRGISSRAWEHPADRGALVALRELRGFDIILRKLASLVKEREVRLQFLGSAIRVDRHQYSQVHDEYLRVAAVLDVAEPPELYIDRNPDLAGMTIGIDKPIIVISSGAVELLDSEELRCLLGHELGHAQSGHALYTTLLLWLRQLASGLSWLPVGSVGVRVFVAALTEWSRKAELSADRAGLLATQSPAAGIRLLAKLAGGGDLSQIDITAFLAQAKEFETGGDIRESLLKLKFLFLDNMSHDFPVERAAALQHWVDEGEYRQILAGDYPKREDDANVSIGAEAKAAARHYKEAFQRSGDPLTSMARRFKDRVNPS